ncbi:MAG: hypothetical protein ACLR5S_10370 [Ruminococcus sp.]
MVVRIGTEPHVVVRTVCAGRKVHEICAKGDFAHFAALYQAADFDMPLIVIADGGTKNAFPDTEHSRQFHAFAAPTQNDLLHFSGRNVQMNGQHRDRKEMHIPPNRWLKRMTGMNRADAGNGECRFWSYRETAGVPL